MTSALLLTFWLTLFVVFAVNQRGYYFFLLFFLTVGGWDAIASLPRVFGYVLPMNLLALQFSLLSVIFLLNHAGTAKEVALTLSLPIRWLFILLACLFAINIPQGFREPLNVAFALLDYVNIALAFLCAPIVLRDAKDFHRAATLITVAILINLIPSVLQLATGKTFMEFYYATERSSFDSTVELPLVSQGVYRIRGFFYSHASFSFALATAVSFLSVSLLVSVRRPFSQFWLVKLGLAAGLVQLYFTFMRGSWLNVAFVATSALLISSRRKVAVAIALLAVLGVLLILPVTTARFQSLDSYEDGTDVTNGRLVLWSRLLALDTGSPILGNGIGSYGYAASAALNGDIIPSHSDFILMHLECGWFTATVLFSAFGALAVYSILISRRLENGFYSAVLLVGGLVLMTQLLQGFFENLMGQSWKLLPVLMIGSALWHCNRLIPENRVPLSVSKHAEAP